MKSTSFKSLFLGLVSVFTMNVYAQDKSDVVFELKASALYNDEPTDNYSILVYENGQLKDSLFIKKTKATTLSLEANKVYSVVYKKENCSEKVVIVNTEIPQGLGELDNEDPFELQIEMSPKVKKIKQEYNDYPVAIITVNKKKRLLMASENYFKQTRG